MADIWSKRKRSEVMSKVRSRGNKDTELALMKLLRVHRITGWRRHLKLPGTPDFVFPKRRLAVFVDGCFWHGCPKHATFPATRRAFWQKKFATNKARDRRVNRELRKLGWRVLRIWEHELRKPKHCIVRISRMLA
jgi:DNA mismatch endonuclease (patch repair protein)